MPIDYSAYPPNWKTELVPAVLSRAKNKCESCGLLNGATVWSVRFKMQARNGRYGYRQVWFRDEQDALREQYNGFDCKPVMVVLTVAHLDHDETNHAVSIGRLQALCQVCHLRYDGKEKFRRMNQPKATP